MSRTRAIEWNQNTGYYRMDRAERHEKHYGYTMGPAEHEEEMYADEVDTNLWLESLKENALYD